MTLLHRWSLPIVLAVGVVGVVLGLVGWKGHLPTLDDLNSVRDAAAFLESGSLPQKGTLTSAGSYAPPGLTWLYLPGVATFDHPGLFASIGSALLYLGAVVGLFVLARGQLGIACALVATILFALSSTGHFFAHSLWPRGHPVFIVWMMVFASRWVSDRDSRFLAAAFAVWGVGMYVFMELAPALFILPVLWWVYRPPIGFRSLAAAAVLLLVVWSPYLAYEADHGLRNVWSQVAQQSLIPADFEASWCDPGLRPVLEDQLGGLDLAGRDSGIGADAPGGFLVGLGIALAGRISVLALALTANFDLSWGSVLVKKSAEAVLGLIVLFVLVVGLSRGRRKAEPPWRRVRWVPMLASAAGGAALVAGVVVNEVLLRQFISRDGHLWPEEIAVIRSFQTVMILGGLGLLARRPLGRLIGRTRDAIVSVREPAFSIEFLRVLAISLVVPAGLLIVLTTPSVARRFMWLWPFQSIFLAVFVVHILPRLAPRPGVAALAAGVLLAAVCGGVVSKQTTSWARRGFSGEEHPFRKTMEFVGRSLREQGHESAMIGYQVPFSGYQASFNIRDPRYKVGALGDFLLVDGFGVRNRNTCAEGVHPDDELRIVTDAPKGKTMAAVVPVSAEGFEVVATFGPYRVIRRVAATDGGA